MRIHSTPLITIALDHRRFLIVISEYCYRRKSLFTRTVAGIVKLYRYNRNIVINVIVINGVFCEWSRFRADAFKIKIIYVIIRSLKNLLKHSSRPFDENFKFLKNYVLFEQ